MKYQKPKKLSDPCGDWIGCEDELAAIVAKSDAELDHLDFHDIYSKFLPAAAYDEGCYYLEKYAEYASTGMEVRISRCEDSWLWWINKHKIELIADDLYLPAKGLVINTFNRILSKFQLFDLSEEECRKLGKNFNWSIGPHNQQTACAIFEALVTEPGWEQDADAWFEQFSKSNDSNHIRWYVELAHCSRGWAVTFDSSRADCIRQEAWFHKFHDFNLFVPKWRLARDASSNEGKRKYNRLVSLT